MQHMYKFPVNSWIIDTVLISRPTFKVLSLPMCLEYNNGSQLTPDNGDRQLSQTPLHLRRRAVMFTELQPSRVNVFATVVGWLMV